MPAERRRGRCLAAVALLLLTGIPLLASQAPAPPAEAEEVLGAPSALSLSGSGAEPRLTVAAGTRLYERPTLTSPALLTFDADTELEALASQGAWRRVRVGALKGWVLVKTSEASAAEPARRPATDVDPDRLARARAAFAAPPTEGTLGPFTLLTDVSDGRLVERLAAVANNLGTAFAERYGTTPPAAGKEWVVLFRDLAAYREFAESEPQIAEVAALGHAGGGLAALAQGELAEAELSGLLVHELTHLLAHRTFGNDLPPWLDEALAEDLAYCQVDGRGRLRLGTLAGSTVISDALARDPLARLTVGREIELRGPRSVLRRLVDAWGSSERLPLEDILDLSWSELAAGRDRGTHYAEAAFFVRYLLDGGQRGDAAAFRAYLAAIAAGGVADSPALLARLGRPATRLESELGAWLQRQAALELPGNTGRPPARP